MESYLTITQINDFIFCPRSILFHNFLQDNFSPSLFRETPQLTGLAAHASLDSGNYSSLKRILQGTMVYSEKYRLFGKIDTFDVESGILTERKYSVTAVYDGFRYQLYAQYYALTEMGYAVKKLTVYSSKDNRKYPVALPDDAKRTKFEEVLKKIRCYEPESAFAVNPAKCAHCNYREICDLCPEECQ